MKRLIKYRYLLCFGLLASLLGVLLGGQLVLAAQEGSDLAISVPPGEEEEPTVEEPIVEKLELVSRFPVKQGESGESFDFEVQFNYHGSEPRVFDFELTPPSGWQVAVHRYFSEEQQETVLAKWIEPDLTYPERVQVVLSPLPGNTPEPGEYVLTFAATSGTLSDSIELKAVVTGVPLTYELKFSTITGRLDYPVKPGEDNLVMLKVANTGTGPISNISFTSVKSEGWGTTFSPAITDTLEPGQSFDAEMVITPPRNTIAGDYRVLIRVGGDSPDMRLQEQVDLRIRVQTPSVWGAAGIGIVAAVIAALAVMFRRLGRR
jgi:uncharacterized membrane protein